jgi:hypothetical protein
VTSTALLIGAETNGLTGVGNDVAAMNAALTRRGFDVTTCEGPQATRAGILAAYESLIQRVRPDDTVVVYYSGHGGLLKPPDPLVRQPLQFIVPSDYADSTDGDFRGVTSVELSVLLARLTDVTRNVTVIVDCCHAAHMSRDPRSTVKALPRTTFAGYRASYDVVARHVETLKRQGLQADLRQPFGNEHAVRIVACAPEQSAYEYTNHDEKRIGVLTEALTGVLDEAVHVPATWSTVLERTRRRVSARFPSQRPEIEGPSRRLLFELDELDSVAAMPVTDLGAGRVRLDGARLLGVQVGDELMIMPPGSHRGDEDASLGEARTVHVGAISAEAAVTLRGPVTGLPLGAVAFRRRAVAEPMPVRLPEDERWAALLVAAMARSPLVRPAGPDDDPVIRIEVDENGRSAVHDNIGPLTTPGPTDEAAANRTVTNLERRARADAVRALAPPPDATLDASVTLEWGRIVDGGQRLLPPSGAVVFAGEHLYVRVRNDDERTVYVSLLDVGVAAGVAVLTAADPSGVRLEPGEEYLYGRHEQDGQLVGHPVTWPEGFPVRFARPESVIVLITSRPQAVGVLEQSGMRGADKDDRTRGLLESGSPLEQLLAQVASGGTREMGVETGAPVRYAVHTIDFELQPAPPQPIETAPFLIDDRRDQSALLVTARGAAPATVAIRLEELVVHRNRALLGADIRVDTVVLTGGGNLVEPHAQTERFPNVRDRDRLSLSRMLVYHGPAVDYLDIGIWVSRDTADSLALADLLKRDLTGVEAQTALAQLAGLVTSAPHAALAAGAIGAGAIVMNLAYRALTHAVGTSIGLYRTSLLAGEHFGVGRHPARGLLQAQDFSFAYTVEAIQPSL